MSTSTKFQNNINSTVHCDVIIKIFWRKFKIVDRTSKSWAKQEPFKLTVCVITFCFGIIGFQNFCFSIVFKLWLAFFANQYTKSIQKTNFLDSLLQND